MCHNLFITSSGGRFDVNASTPAFESAPQTAGASLRGRAQTQTATRFPVVVEVCRIKFTARSS